MKNDIEKFAERKVPFFFLILSIWLHKITLEETIGDGFTKSIFIHESGTCKLCVSKQEMKKVSDSVQELIRIKEQGFVRWYDKAKFLNKEADKLLSDYENEKPIISVESYDKALNTLISNGGYCTILPYWVLYGINEALEAGADRESFGEVLRMYEELKSETRYPQIAKTVFSVFFNKAMEVLDISYDLATCIHPDELREIILGKKSVTRGDLERRFNKCGITRGKDPYEVQYVFDQQVLDQYSQEVKNVTELKGKIAYAGKIVGVAKIVCTMEDMEKFNEGDVLVSIQSSPALMPALIKCSAIVTDEGGIMCHASIISRELRKPCIIGTKIATKVLKDGDMVEVDAEKGIVRKI